MFCNVATRVLGLFCCMSLVIVGFELEARASSEVVLYSFLGNSDGSDPSRNLTADKAGNLYGTTSQGGAYGFGTVFELSPSKNGWTYSILYSFTGNFDGAIPSSPVIADKAGNLYGTTSNGGANYFGNVYELTPDFGGGWSESTLYSFAGGTDGQFPYGGLIFDQEGSLYGTTYYGGSLTACNGAGCGTVFKLSPNSMGGWSDNIIYSFNELDGALPLSGLVADSIGNLYGTTSVGGSSSTCQGSPANGCGVAFQLAYSNGIWTETVLHNFHTNVFDGTFPNAELTLHAGRLFGTTYGGGSHQDGIIFELAYSSGQWVESILHSFAGGSDGSEPAASVVFDKSGNLFGTTEAGGTTAGCGGSGCGTIFELKASGSGLTESILHPFSGGSDGAQPYGGLIIDRIGDLYGTTSSGGSDNAGIVFEFKP